MSRKKGSMLAKAVKSVYDKPFELPVGFDPFVKEVPKQLKGIIPFFTTI
jgi:hypothetical protein